MKKGDLVIYRNSESNLRIRCTVPQPVLVLDVLEIDSKLISFRGLDSKGGMIHWECSGWGVVWCYETG